MPLCCGKTGQIVFEETRRRGEEELSVDWRVGDIFSLSGYWDDYYDSPYFCFNNACWYFRLFTNVYTRHPASDKSMTLYFNRADSGPPRTVQFTLGIKGAEGVEKMRSGEYPHYSSFPEIWSRLELRNNKSRLMPEDVLTINCDLKIMSKEHGAVGGVSHQDVSIQTCDEFREPNACIDETQPLDKQDSSVQTDEKWNEAQTVTEENQSLKKQGIEKVAEDVGKLLVSGAIKDITVQVGDVEFQVNRNVLLARSRPLCPVPARGSRGGVRQDIGLQTGRLQIVPPLHPLGIHPVPHRAERLRPIPHGLQVLGRRSEAAMLGAHARHAFCPNVLRHGAAGFVTRAERLAQAGL